MDDLKLRLQMTIDKIENITDMLYQEKIGEAMKQLEPFLADIMDICEAFNIVQQQKAIEDSGFEELLAALTQAMNSMDQKDYVLLADTLQYELQDQLLKLMNKV